MSYNVSDNTKIETDEQGFEQEDCDVEFKKKVRKQQDNTYNNELPCLTLKKVKSNADFVTEEILLESKGYSHREAKQGLDKLVKTLKRLQT